MGYRTLFKKLLIVFSMGYLSLTLAVASATPTVWDVVRAQLKLNHAVSQPEVQQQLRWLAAHPGYLEQLTQSEPYIYHIVNEIKKRNLPGELALLPLIESAYDPFAYSGKGAAGLWQLMPGTGSELGLKQDWWFDGRRSIGPSTHAALNYLTHLRDTFHGNWELAIAAYDAGEGRIGNAIKNRGVSVDRAQFWKLSLPQETKTYVPRLLALAEIIKYPERYHVTLPEIPHAPYFKEVNIGSQIDLNRAAKLAGVSYKELIQLNPGYNRWITAPYHPFKLLIPKEKADSFTRNLALVPQSQRVSLASHQVKRGESLPNLAKRYFTTVKLLRELNRLHTNRLKQGQRLLIPDNKQIQLATPAAKPVKNTQPYKVLHIVQPHETLALLAKKYKVSLKDLCTWNTMAENASLSKNQQLIIWKNPMA